MNGGGAACRGALDDERAEAHRRGVARAQSWWRLPGWRRGRPSARARQAAFDMLLHAPWGGADFLRQARVLDVFAGTGAYGLEALSRGAAGAVFFERAPAALAALSQNIAACRAEARAQVIAGDVLAPPFGRAAPTGVSRPALWRGLCAACAGGVGGARLAGTGGGGAGGARARRCLGAGFFVGRAPPWQGAAGVRHALARPEDCSEMRGGAAPSC